MEVLKTFSNFDQDKLAIKLLRPNYFDSWFIPREYWSPSSLKLSGGIRNFILRATAYSLCSPTPPTDLSVLSPQDLCITTSIFYAPTSWELYLKTESVVSQSCLTHCDPMDYAYQAPLSMEFSGQEYWSGLPFHYLFPWKYMTHWKCKTYM